MSSRLAAPRVKPQVALIPKSARSDGADAAELAEAFGIVADDWQRYALAAALGRTGSRWSAGEVGLEIPRQNGKTVVLMIRALWGLWGTDERLITWTAHEYKTAREAFLEMRNRIEGSAMAGDVKGIRTFPQLEIELRDGSRVIFLARTAGSGRGFSGDCVILDEAFEVTNDQMAALMPTLSARPDPQLWYASMAGTATSDHLRRVRDRATVGEDPRLCYLGWAAVPPYERAVDLDDRKAWQRANPAVPDRLSWSAIEQERAALSAEDFARERLGIWSDVAIESVIPADTWHGLKDPHSQAGDRLGFGIAVGHDHKRATVAVASPRPDGRIHVEVAERRAGSSWVVDWVIEREKRWRPAGWALNPAAPAGHLIAPLVRAKVDPLLMSGREWAQACGSVYTAAIENRLRHLGQAELASAVDGATKRPLAEAWQWHPAEVGTDITPLQACTLAVAALGSPKARKQRSGRMVAG